MKIRRFVALLGLAASAWTAGVAQAQVAPLKIIVPYAAGGLADMTARMMSEPLSQRLGQPVVVDNRPGANGTIGAAAVAHAAPDGNTVGLVVSSHVFGKVLMPNLPFDPVADFEPISLATRTAMVLVATPTLPVQNVDELIAYVKARPNEVAFASAGYGSNVHIFGQWFADLAGLEMLHVPYKGSAAAHIDLIAGRTQIVFDTLGAVQPHLATNKMKLIAAGAQRLPQYPDVRAVAEYGFEGFRAESWGAFLAPRGTPRGRIDQLHQAIVEVLALPAIRDRLAEAGAQVVGSSPDELGAMLTAEEQQFRALITRMGITL